MSDPRYEISTLIEHYLLGCLTEEESLALWQRLEDDPELANELWNQTRLDELLNDQMPSQIYCWQNTRSDELPGRLEAVKPRSTTPTPLQAPARSPSVFSSGKLFSSLLAANLIGIVVVIALLMMPGGGTIHRAFKEKKPDAVIVRSHNAVWEGNLSPTLGESGFTGWLHLLDGLTEIEFGSGVRAFIEGGTQLQVVSSNRAHCSKGRVGAMVSPAAVGFTVTTPHVTVVDLGTAFELNITEQGTDIFVLEGRVVLRDIPVAKELTKGESIRISLDGTSEPIDFQKNNAGFRGELKESHQAMVDRWRNCRILVYRGLSKEAPENTLAAFRRAIEAGVDACSMDLARCRDGTFVLLADNDLRRTTRSEGDVRKLDYADVRRRDAGSWKGAEFAGERIPTLVETLELFKNSDCRPYIEIKDIDHVDGLLQCLRAAGMTDRVVLTASQPGVLQRIRQSEPKAATCWRFASKAHSPGQMVDEAKRYGVNQVIFGTQSFDSAWGAALRDEGVAVGVWPVDDERPMKQFLDRGVDFLGTNRPDLLKRIVRKNESKGENP